MIRRNDALEYHRGSRPGKLEVVPTKPLVTQRDLSLAYSPGVAEPCLEIARDPELCWEYTARGNLVAVITNGTAVLGLGNIGPLAAKPVMEGKACLFKKFADIDVYDLELQSRDVRSFVEAVASLEPTFGGINLEDLKAPECFEIETGLRARMNIPVFHDDQHGTAIISGAALLNGAELCGKRLGDLKVVVSGAGASAIACAMFYVQLGVPLGNITMIDSMGVIYEGRKEGMNAYKERFARADNGARTRADALRGADVFLGLSKAGLVTREMLLTMADRPMIFALANPDPEVSYPDAKAARPDAIVATGRSDFPNQVNNVLGFPYIFRGALDVRARDINETMKVAAAHSLAALAHEPVPDSVSEAYGVESFRFGADYIIPKPLDPRVLWWCAPAVAKAAMDSGVARISLDLDEYRERLQRRMGGAPQTIMRRMIARAKTAPKRIVFPEGDNIKVLRACQIILDEGIARPVLLGQEKRIRARAEELDLDLEGVEIIHPADSLLHAPYARELFDLRCRKGVNAASATRQMSRRITFGVMMVRRGEADGLVAGLTAPYPETIRPALQILGIRPDVRRATSMYMMLLKNDVKFFADPSINIEPDAETLADTAIQVADAVRAFEVTPRIAMISFSNFGSAPHPQSIRVAEAVEIVRRKRPELEIDGEVQADIALDNGKLHELFPFTRLTDGANVLVFPSLAAGNAAYKVLAALGGATAVGPILLGLNKPITVLPRDANVDTIVSMTAYTVTQAQDNAR
ncbi:MAG TPA: NADP-dependent malic enzyme [Polyangia bacterium]|jgi:malate dehydrogenase (oxaloacetate-decarboxylating)(NADP+)|nr:NADP-dependent malic enzyme [Polyangia bacterium]